jgi:hypothetical protein
MICHGSPALITCSVLQSHSLLIHREAALMTAEKLLSAVDSLTSEERKRLFRRLAGHWHTTSRDRPIYRDRSVCPLILVPGAAYPGEHGERLLVFAGSSQYRG